MRHLDVAERRARVAVRHHLAPSARAHEVAEVARDLVALHATDAASVYLAAAARMQDATIASIETELYDKRSVVRILGMRRTVFVVPAELVPVVHGACTRSIEVVERRKLVQFLERAGIAADGARWLRRVEDLTVKALAARGEATAVQLAQDVPSLRTQILFGEGKKWEGYQGVSTRVLFLLAAQGRIVRGRPLGSWTSAQYRWAPMASWRPDLVAERPSPEARVDLARAWLAAFGPAPVADLKWWTGWTVAQVKEALAVVAPVEVDLDGTPGIVLNDDLAPVAGPEPWVALLPALDPTVMGWQRRDWYLGEHALALFDRSGNAGPTVWCNGRIVGGWGQRQNGDIAFRLFEDVGSDAVAEVEAAAGELDVWLGGLRVTPRFRTPLERELAT
jgi:hypothetical protein